MGLEDAGAEVDRALSGAGPGYGFENVFAGATSFLRRRYTKTVAGADLAIFGVPFDQAVTNRPGTRLGPRAIREASALQTVDPPFGWDVNPLTDFDLVDAGDVAFDYARVSEFPAVLEAHVAALLAADVGTLALGGDHSISYPILKAYAEKFGPLALVQFDAHTDTWRDDDRARVDHGTMFYKAVRDGIVDAARSVQVGIRTVNDDTLGIAVIDAPEVHRLGPEDVSRKIIDITGDSAAYLTFDIDCLDPAFAPGTGTPVWGGLSSAQAAAILRGLAGLNMVGGDVVEVSPPFDPSGATAIAGAHAAMELACLYCHNLRGKNLAQSTD